MKIRIEEVEEFVRRDYAEKDIMHGLDHIKHILKEAQKIAEHYDYDPQTLMLGAYFHGIIYKKETEIREFLKNKGFSESETEKVVKIAWESQKDSEPETAEGSILHDAHLIEGGKTFLITKSLVTGTARGQSLEETISFIEQNLLGKFKCHLPEAQKIYEQKESFAREFLDDLRNNL